MQEEFFTTGGKHADERGLSAAESRTRGAKVSSVEILTMSAKN